MQYIFVISTVKYCFVNLLRPRFGRVYIYLQLLQSFRRLNTTTRNNRSTKSLKSRRWMYKTILSSPTL